MIDEQNQPEKTLEHSESPAESFEYEESESPQSLENEEPTAQAEANLEATTGGESGLHSELGLAIETLQLEKEGLKKQLEELTQQADSYKTQYMRIAADFDNFRKRTSKEKEDLELKVKRETISALLPVVDNFERARSQIKPVSDGEMAIHKSYQSVYKNLVDGLKRIGVSAMRPEGEPFDPNFHEAMMREPTNEYPEDAVIEQLVRGYLIGDRVLRHAMVKVAAPLDPVVTSEEGTSAEENTPNN